MSILEVLSDMKKTCALERNKKKGFRKGKHSGSTELTQERIKEISLCDIDIPASIRQASGHPDTGSLRLKRYTEKRQTAILFVVDASRSQGAQDRLSFAKGAVLAILDKAYCDRDKVGMILFGDRQAELLLPYTKSVDLAAEKMKKLKARGNTPLGMGLRLAFRTIEGEMRKYPQDNYLTVLLTDGKSNFDQEQGTPWKLALKEAEKFREKNYPLLVVDTENSVFGLGLAKKVAQEAGGEYVQSSR